MGENEPQPRAVTPSDTAQYWREQYEWSQEQLSMANEVAEKLSRELREALCAVKTLARLVWNGNL